MSSLVFVDKAKKKLRKASSELAEKRDCITRKVSSEYVKCNLTSPLLYFTNKINEIVSADMFIPWGMSKVLDHLYLGTFDDAINKEMLKRKGITHIVNTIEYSYDYTQTGAHFYGDGFEYFGFTSKDEDNYPIMKHYDDTHKFIEHARASGGKCLVHCMAGVNRSGVLVTAYVMNYKKTNPITAVKDVLNARGILLTNPGFIESLVTWAADKDMLYIGG